MLLLVHLSCYCSTVSAVSACVDHCERPGVDTKGLEGLAGLLSTFNFQVLVFLHLKQLTKITCFVQLLR